MGHLPLLAAGAANAIGAVVKAWNDERGFGFVTVDGGGEDVYVHRTAIADGSTLMPGARVQVEVKFDPSKGKMAAAWCTGAVPKGAGKGMSGCSEVFADNLEQLSSFFFPDLQHGFEAACCDRGRPTLLSQVGVAAGTVVEGAAQDGVAEMVVLVGVAVELEAAVVLVVETLEPSVGVAQVALVTVGLLEAGTQAGVDA